jgi:hypothetical protein
VKKYTVEDLKKKGLTNIAIKIGIGQTYEIKKFLEDNTKAHFIGLGHSIWHDHNSHPIWKQGAYYITEAERGNKDYWMTRNNFDPKIITFKEFKEILNELER